MSEAVWLRRNDREENLRPQPQTRAQTRRRDRQVGLCLNADYITYTGLYTGLSVYILLRRESIRVYILPWSILPPRRYTVYPPLKGVYRIPPRGGCPAR